MTNMNMRMRMKVTKVTRMKRKQKRKMWYPESLFRQNKNKNTLDSLFSNAWGSNTPSTPTTGGNNNNSSPQPVQNNNNSFLNWDSVQTINSPTPNTSSSFENLLSTNSPSITPLSTTSNVTIPTRFSAIYNNPYNSSESTSLLSSTVTGSFALTCNFLRRQSIQGRNSNVVQLSIENQNSSPIYALSMETIQGGPEITNFTKIDELSSG